MDNVKCGCVQSHAVTPNQKRYAKRMLTVAYSMKDYSAVSKIREALQPCPRRISAKQQEQASNDLTRISAMVLIDSIKKGS